MSKSIYVQSEGRQYVLLNITDKRSEELHNDAEKLNRFFHQCITTGENICLLQCSSDDENCPPPSNNVSNSISKQIPHVKRPAVSKSASTVTSITKKVKPTDSVDELSISSGVYDTPLTCTTKAAVPMYKTVAIPSICKAKAAPSTSATKDEKKVCDELLVGLVMDQPMLYNYKLSSNKFAGAKAEKWKKICDELNKVFSNANLTVAKTKDRWTNLRDEYLGRQRSNCRVTGDGFKEPETDPLDELMFGLSDIYDIRKTTSNICEPGTSAAGLTANGATSKQRKIINKKIEEEALEIIESSSDKFLNAVAEIQQSLLGSKESQCSQNQDKVTVFCDMLKFNLRELNDDSFLKAQIGILQVIHKLKQEQ